MADVNLLHRDPGLSTHATSLFEAGDLFSTVTLASVSIQTLAPQLKGLSGL